MSKTVYQFGYETKESRKSSAPARFANLTRDRWEAHLGAEAVANILQGDYHWLPNGTVFYLHSTFTD